MKILQIANKVPYPPKDGGSIATFAMSRGFTELGHEVTVLAMSTTKHPVSMDDIPLDVKDKIRFILVDMDTRIKAFDALRNLLFSSLPYNAERFISDTFNQRLDQLLEEEPFDLIQLEGLYLAPYVPTIRKRTKALISMRAHNIEHEIWNRTVKQKRGLVKMYTALLASRVKNMELSYLNSYDAMVPITSRDNLMLKQMGCLLPAHVAPTGIDMSGFQKYNEKPHFPSLFHIGALDWSPNQEGLDWFIKRCWRQLYKSFPDLKFYIAGRNAPDQIRNMKEAGVVFVGEVDDAYAFMQGKAIMVVPLLSGSGMRIKIIEGMALGKTIVSTSIGAEGIGVSHDHNILIADDPENFTGAIKGLLNNFDKFEATGRNAREFVEKNYDNYSISEALAGFYKELI